jgi:ADP-heptose:LPS heptosyltransferase
LTIIDRELANCQLENTILIDPDSRLSQLGVLPIIDQENYYFFDSRSAVSYDGNLSMAQLTNTWLNRITNSQAYHHPKVWLSPETQRQAKQLVDQLRSNGARRLLALNFGVGGNPRKKVGHQLEQELLLTLLQEPDTVILLDKGTGDEEVRSSDALLDGIKTSGYRVYNGSFDQPPGSGISWGVIGLQTRIGEIAAIIANCDEYIGYDSACQHFAAALNTPSLTIFAGSNNMRFIRRWSASGPNSCKIVHVDTLRDRSSIDVEDIIIRIMNARRVAP